MTVDCVLLKDSCPSLVAGKDPKPIFEPLSEYYKDHATLPNAGYPPTGYSDHRPAGTAQVLVTSE